MIQYLKNSSSKLILLAFLLPAAVFYGCSDNTVTLPEYKLLYEKTGTFDSLSRTTGIPPVVTGPDTNLIFSPYTSAKISFDYRAKGDSVIFDYFRSPSGSKLFTFKRKFVNTNDEYIRFDTIVSRPASPDGNFSYFFYVYNDSSMFVVKNFKIFGIY